MLMYFLIVSLVCGLLILFVALLTRILHNKIERKWRYILWIVLAVRLLFPVDVSIPTPVFTVELPSMEESVQTPIQMPTTNVVVPQYPSTNDVQPSTPVVPQTPSVSPSISVPSVPQAPTEPEFVFEWSMVWDMLPWIWAIGMIISALWYLIGYAYQKRELLRWSYSAMGMQAQLDAYIQKLELRRRVSVKKCKKIATPMMVGLFQSVLLMPECQYNAQELDYIFHHELLHIKRRDVWVKSLMLAVRVIHWFNPAVLLMSWEMNEDIEILCDAQVVRDMGAQERREYNEVLFRHLARRNEENMLFSTCFGSRLQKAKDRLVQVAKGGKLRKCYILCTVLLIAVLVCSLLVSYGGTEEENSGKEESSREEVSKEEESSREESWVEDENADLPESEIGRMAYRYLEVINHIEDTYGVPYVESKTTENLFLKGTYQLLDFDGDGTEELYCVFCDLAGDGTIYEEIYQYADGSCKRIWSKVLGNSNGVAYSALIKVDDKVYIHTKNTDGKKGSYITVQNGQMSASLEYTLGSNGSWLDGKVVTENGVYQGMNDFEAGGQQLFIQYNIPSAEEVEYLSFVKAALQEAIEEGKLDLSGMQPNWQLCVPRTEAEPTVMAAPAIQWSWTGSWVNAYCRKIEELQNEHGQNLLAVRLLDMGLNWPFELYCAYIEGDNLHQVLYGYNKRIELLYENVMCIEENQIPTMEIIEQGTAQYLIISNGSSGEILSGLYRELEVLHSFDYGYVSNNPMWDGQTMSWEEVEENYSAFLEGAERIEKCNYTLSGYADERVTATNECIAV
ncbi:MAG: M56 family metallopeptidase, partial [Firmicutes bacterium]|nr:M56 family metallopeptidase [Bacillota bacterium]